MFLILDVEMIYGLVKGETSRIIFLIVTYISRFEIILIDLSETCQDIDAKY